ncbi:MAG: hypothetical protein U0176_12560 [Bacteroidia bacterium]
MHHKLLRLFLLLLCMGMATLSMAQLDSLNAIENKLWANKDNRNLLLLAPYLDRNDEVEEFLGYHRLKTPLKQIAARLIAENTLFFSQGLESSKTLTAKSFTEFLESNPVRWTDTLEAYVAADWRQKGVPYKVRGLTGQQWLNRQKSFTDQIGSNRFQNPVVRQMWEAKDPRILLEIAAGIFKGRHRWGSDLGFGASAEWLEYLVHFQVAVQDGKGDFSYDMTWDYTNLGRMNLLNFWLEHHGSFVWNRKVGYFESKDFPLPTYAEEVDLFPLLGEQDDSIAHRTFMRLAVGNPEVVPDIARDWDDLSPFGNLNFSLGSFPLRFLEQLPLMAGYCRAHGISYEGSAQLKDWGRRMLACKSLKGALALEAEILAGLKQKDVTALEFWAATHQNAWQGQVIVGRVLDEYYTIHWRETLADTAALELYLRKSGWFEGFGIVGYARQYLNKFRGQPESVLWQLEAIHPGDQTLQAQVDSAKKYVMQRPSAPSEEGSSFEWARHHADLQAAWDSTIRHTSKGELDYKLSEIVAGLSYDQIDEAIEVLAVDSLLKDNFPGDRYEFLEGDFGLAVDADSMVESGYRAEFLRLYRTLTEEGLYLYYLRRAGVEILLPDGSLDYHRVYGVLEFGLPEAFVSMGGSGRYGLVYSVVKVLELRHGKRLGEREKLCGYGRSIICSPRQRAQAWMKWLVEQGKVYVDPDRAHSFGYEY